MKGAMHMTKKTRKGQTMVEYIIIIALVAIAGIAVWSYFGRATAKKVAGATESLSSSEGASAKSAAQSIGEDSIKKLGE